MARRAYGSGSIYQLPDGNWQALARVQGRQISHTAKTQREANAWLERVNLQVEQGLTYQAAKINLEDYLTRWLASVENALRPASFEHYKIAVENHLIPALGEVLVKDLTPDRIQQVYDNWLRSGKGVATVQKAHAVLHRALRRATQTGLLASNPASLVSKPRSPHKEMSFWTEDEANRFLTAARENRLYALFHLAIVTGAKQSELLGLQWSDLDWSRGTLHICRQLSQSGNFAALRSKAAKRTLQLGNETLTVLREHVKLQQLERQVAGDRWQEGDLLFTTTIGTPLYNRNLVARNFKLLAQAAGVPQVRFHDLRDSCVAILLAHGVPIYTISKWIGHAKPSITNKVYGHLIPGAEEGVGQLMDDLVSPVVVEFEESQT